MVRLLASRLSGFHAGVVVLAVVVVAVLATSRATEEALASRPPPVWAILLPTSRYYHNYRHSNGAAYLAHLLARRGVPAASIVLGVPDDHLCSTRHADSGQVIPVAEFMPDSESVTFLCEAGVFPGTGPRSRPVILRGYDVGFWPWRGLTTGLMRGFLPGDPWPGPDPADPLARPPNILLDLNGHSSAESMRFHDAHALSPDALLDWVLEMDGAGRYHELLIVIDTCHAHTFGNALRGDRRVRNVLFLSSAGDDEDSQGTGAHPALGLGVSDRFHGCLAALLDAGPTPDTRPITTILSTCTEDHVKSTPELEAFGFSRPLESVQFQDFFGPGLAAGAKPDSTQRPASAAGAWRTLPAPPTTIDAWEHLVKGGGLSGRSITGYPYLPRPLSTILNPGQVPRIDLEIPPTHSGPNHACLAYRFPMANADPHILPCSIPISSLTLLALLIVGAILLLWMLYRADPPRQWSSTQTHTD